MIKLEKEDILRFKDSFSKITNYPLENYSDEIIETALIDNMIILDLTDVDEYIANIQKNLYLAEKFITSLSVPISQFLRNFGFLLKLKDRVIKDLILQQALKRNGQMYVLTIGCATGEEPYSIAILLEETKRELNIPLEIEVYTIDAMDLNKEAVAYAKRGLYNQAKLRNLPKAWIDRYFDRFSRGYKIKDFIKSKCHFIQIDVLENFHMDKHYHLIFIRNVMIYWGDSAKNAFIRKLVREMHPGDKLILGQEERIEFNSDKFSLKKVSGFDNVYEKR